MDYSNIIAEISNKVHTEISAPLNKMQNTKAAAVESGIIRSPQEQHALDALTNNIMVVAKLEESINLALRQISAEQPTSGVVAKDSPSGSA